MIRLSAKLSLIFFALTFSCNQRQETELQLIWKDEKAVSIKIPKSLLSELDEDALSTQIQVSLENSPATAILGHYEEKGDAVIFSPFIPLSRGLTYTIQYKGRQLGKLAVASADPGGGSRIVAIYPTDDTVPANLLKIYLQFSAPMRAGESLKHIYLLDDKQDTLKHTFLDLQPELWNKDNTVLTLWLDPGRIKRDLIPNQQMGNPLSSYKHYTLVVDEQWKDVQDRPLKASFKKEFFVTARDEASPGAQQWTLTLPATATRQPLTVSFPEALDYFLLQETIKIYDEKEREVDGRFDILKEEKSIQFTPKQQWSSGKYRLSVATYLEDLAGNNIEKLFDRDITKPVDRSDKKSERYFSLPVNKP